MVCQQYIDEAALFISLGLFTMTLAYLSTRPERDAVAIITKDDVKIAADTLDWRAFALACAPLAILTYEGRGYNNSLAPGTAGSSTNVASAFLVVLISLAAFGFLLKHGMRWFVCVLFAQSILLAAAGERLPLVIGGVELLVLLGQAGLRPTRRQVSVTLMLVVLSVLGITGYRATSGRQLYYQNSGVGARVAAVGSGLYTLTHASNSTDSGPGLIAQAATRFDGNAFAGGIIQAIHFGDPTIGSLQVGETTLLAIPHAMWPSKLSHSAVQSPALDEINSFHLQSINFLPTMPGLYIGFVGPYLLLPLLAIIGLLFGFWERLLFRRSSPIRLVVLAAAVQAALVYEKGLPGMLVALRIAVVLAASVWLFELIAVRTHHSMWLAKESK